MKLLLSCLLGFVSSPVIAPAQSSAFWDINSQRRAGTIPAVRLVKPAEVLAADVTLVATQRNAQEQAAAFTSALALFRAEIARTGNVTIKLERTEQGGGSPSSYSSGKFDTNRSFAELCLQIPLQEKRDSSSAAQELRMLIARVKLPADVAIKIEALRVEVRDPDALRHALLQAIAEDSLRVQEQFKGAPLRVTGLEAAVQQRPLNDREVLVFLPYTLALGRD